MKFENQFCTKEQGKRLQELGVYEHSMFYHVEGMMIQPYNHISCTGRFEANDTVHEIIEGVHSNYCYPAFTVAELGLMLPNKFKYEGEESCVTTTKYSDKDYLNAWIAGIFWTAKPNIRYATPRKYFPASTEAQARAAMLIYLLENNHITAQEVNERLQAA